LTQLKKRDMTRDDLDRHDDHDTDEGLGDGHGAPPFMNLDDEEDAAEGQRQQADAMQLPYFSELNILRDTYARVREMCETFPGGEGLGLQHIPQVLKLGENMYDAWMTRLRSLSATAMSSYALAMFGFGHKENQEGMDYNQLIKSYTDYITPVIQLQKRLAMLLALGEGQLDAQVVDALTDMSTDRLTLVKHAIARMKHHIESLRDCHTLARVTTLTELGQVNNPIDVSFLEQNGENMDAIHHLIVYIANRLQAHQLKRFRDRCYEQRFILAKERALDAHGHLTRATVRRIPTRCWKEHCKLEAFINRQCDKENNFRYWKTLTGSRDMTKRLVDHFCSPSGGESEFPELQVNRYWFAFANGIYDCEQQQFYFYDEAHMLPQKAGVSWACVNLFEDVEFNVNIMDDSVASLEEILKVPTPVLDSIFTHQQMDSEIIKWFHVFFGRMFYPLHQFDKWQVVAFIKGVAGTGKSTLGNLLLSIFPMDLVGNLSSNIEEQFGLAAIADCLMWICLEVKSNFKLPLNDLQSMISGELVQIAAKFKDARTVKWSAPGMMFGNEVPPWKDIAGALMRRFVLFMFEQKVDESKVNSGLLDQLRKELGTIIPKVTMIYRAVAFAGEHSDIWHHLPEYFKLTRRKFLTSTSPIATFLDETTQFKKENTGYTKLQEFSNHFVEWMKQNRPADKVLNMTPDNYSTPFQQNALSVKREERMWEGQKITADFIFGLSMVGHVY